jgi:hypothetical protein
MAKESHTPPLIEDFNNVCQTYAAHKKAVLEL